jgi:hypothetical protein
MHLWTPPRDKPELLSWWGPLLLVGRLAREKDVPWPIHIDQFDLLGRVDRSGSRQPIWVYRHQSSGGDIFADPRGQTYRYRPTPRAAAAGRFERCDVRESIYRAGLPEVVEAGEDVDRVVGPSWSDGVDGTAMAAHPTTQARRSCQPARSRVPRQDRWLHLVPALPA